MLRDEEPSSSDTKTLTSMTFSDDRAVMPTAFIKRLHARADFQLMQLAVPRLLCSGPSNDKLGKGSPRVSGALESKMRIDLKVHVH